MVNNAEYIKIPNQKRTSGCMGFITNCLYYFKCIKITPQKITDDRDWLTIDDDWLSIDLT